MLYRRFVLLISILCFYHVACFSQRTLAGETNEVNEFDFFINHDKFIKSLDPEQMSELKINVERMMYALKNYTFYKQFFSCMLMVKLERMSILDLKDSMERSSITQTCRYKKILKPMFIRTKKNNDTQTCLEFMNELLINSSKKEIETSLIIKFLTNAFLLDNIGEEELCEHYKNLLKINNIFYHNTERRRNYLLRNLADADVSEDKKVMQHVILAELLAKALECKLEQISHYYGWSSKPHLRVSATTQVWDWYYGMSELVDSGIEKAKYMATVVTSSAKQVSKNIYSKAYLPSSKKLFQLGCFLYYAGVVQSKKTPNSPHYWGHINGTNHSYMVGDFCNDKLNIVEMDSNAQLKWESKLEDFPSMVAVKGCDDKMGDVFGLSVAFVNAFGDLFMQKAPCANGICSVLKTAYQLFGIHENNMGMYKDYAKEGICPTPMSDSRIISILVTAGISFAGCTLAGYQIKKYCGIHGCNARKETTQNTMELAVSSAIKLLGSEKPIEICQKLTEIGTGINTQILALPSIFELEKKCIATADETSENILVLIRLFEQFNNKNLASVMAALKEKEKQSDKEVNVVTLKWICIYCAMQGDGQSGIQDIVIPDRNKMTIVLTCVNCGKDTRQRYTPTKQKSADPIGPAPHAGIATYSPPTYYQSSSMGYYPEVHSAHYTSYPPPSPTAPPGEHSK